MQIPGLDLLTGSSKIKDGPPESTTPLPSGTEMDVKSEPFESSIPIFHATPEVSNGPEEDVALALCVDPGLAKRILAPDYVVEHPIDPLDLALADASSDIVQDSSDQDDANLDDEKTYLRFRVLVY